MALDDRERLATSQSTANSRGTRTDTEQVDLRQLRGATITIVLGKGRRIEGRVVDKNGGVRGIRLHPVPSHVMSKKRSHVLAYLEKEKAGPLSRLAMHTITGPTGEFGIGGLRSIEYALFVVSPLGQLTTIVDHVPAGARGLEITIDVPHALEGVTIDPEGRPVKGASVALKTNSVIASYFPARIVTRTKDGGRFELGPLAKGDYFIEISAENFVKKRLDVTVPGELDSIELEPALSLSGRVVDEDEKPIVGALLWAVPEEEAIQIVEMPRRSAPGKYQHLETTSDEAGVFEISGLSEGIFFIEVNAPGYALSGIIKSEFTAGQAGIVLRIACGQEIIGRAVDADTGAGIVGARVSVSGRSVWSDQDGEFFIDCLVPEEFDGRYLYYNDFVIEHGDYSRRRVGKIEFTEGRPKDLKVELYKHALLSGRVIDEQGVGVSRAKLQVVAGGAEVALSTRPQDTTYTDSQGYFVLAWNRGRRGLWIMHPAYAKLRVPSIVPANLKQRNVEFRLTRGASISGRVVNAKGAAIDRAVVTLLRYRSKNLATISSLMHGSSDVHAFADEISEITCTAESDVNGEFRFDRVEKEPYEYDRRNAGHSRDLPQTQPYHYRIVVDRVGYSPLERAVNWDQGEHKVFEFTLTKGLGISGRVIDDRGALEDARVSVYVKLPATDGLGRISVAEALTDHDGRFELDNLPRGVVLVEIQARGYQGYRGELAVGDSHNEIQFDLVRLPQLSLTVVDAESGWPIMKYKVRVWGRRSHDNLDDFDCEMGPRSLEFEAVDGVCVLEELCPNTEYVVNVSASGYCAVRRSADILQTEHNILRVALKRGLVIKGAVLERETDVAVEGASIQVRKKEPEGERWMYYEGQTDGRGETAGIVIGPGFYDIEIVHSDYSVMKERIEVPSHLEGRVREFVWRLNRAGSLRGRITFEGKELGLDRVFDHVFLSLEGRQRDIEGSASRRVVERYKVDLRHTFVTGSPSEYFEIENIVPGEYNAFLVLIRDQLPQRTFLGSVKIRRGEQSVVEFSSSGTAEADG